ncbi:LysR family transcriptional regulator [Scandinavium sp. NPDC088450]|uniref:LysR family transcriptional regulator n=1 Tax=Scandinavium sp. NPDC088450 TaxID=3364514 RepID=UPI00384D1A61
MIKEIDLKLLKVIHTIVTTGTVTEAARTLKQSAGNISYQLSKARELTGAHLFIRTREGMKPDATALELSERYRQFEERDGLSLELPTEDVIRSALHINTYSLLEMMLAISACDAQKKDTSLRYIFHSYISAPEERLTRLRNKTVDIDIGNKLPVDPSVTAIKLFTSNVSVLRGQHNQQQEPLNMELLCSARHAIWSALPDYYAASVEGAMTMSSFMHSRDIAVVSGSMINMVSLCACSQYVMLIPEFFSSMIEKNFSVKCLPTPDELDIRYDCYLHYATKPEKEVGMLDAIHEIVASMARNKPCYEAVP